MRSSVTGVLLSIMFSRLILVVTHIRTSFHVVAEYDSVVCLVFNAEEHPCALRTPKNHVPDFPGGQSDSQCVSEASPFPRLGAVPWTFRLQLGVEGTHCWRRQRSKGRVLEADGVIVRNKCTCV